jgi:multidrug transporter EmrE-like cation transporter
MNVAVIAIAILVIASVVATLWAKRSDSGTQRQTKIVLFALYFWILVFVQLILAAIAYSVWTG